LIALAVGLAALAGYWLGPHSGWHRVDYLALAVISFLGFLVGSLALCLGKATLRAHAFPLAFLIFMVPFPTVVRNAIETFFQHASADAGYAFLTLSGTPVFRQGLAFLLSTIRIEVAQECSGIHSSLVLFITSLLAGHLFLRTPWKRAGLVLAVIPLAILRNGFRIATIGLLCVHVSPNMSHSPIHHRGGPIFFVLSLIPFFLFLWWLRRTERDRRKGQRGKG